MAHSRLYEIFSRLQQANPEPTTELVYSSHFELLIAVVLSAQATDVSVNKATRTLFREASSPAAMLALGEAGIKRHIKSIGLFNSKARNILLACKQLIDRHGGRVPDNREALTALAGVGRKTANVILNTAFGKPALAVDTHIFRLSNRIPLAKAKTVLGVEQKLVKVIPRVFLKNAHHWLILHGRYTCTARKPKCGSCTLVDLCRYPQKHTENS